MPEGISRRRFLGAAGAAAGAGMGLAGLPEPVLRALAATPACGRLTDIDHVVILIQENRSFDHYLGTQRGVRGWADPAASAVWAQAGYDGGGVDPGRLLPFHLDTAHSNAECTNDITHEWGAQHRAWNGGAMDAFVTTHVQDDGPQNGPLTMGYYTRADLPFLHSLADAFTVCDEYYCSVIGPTDPNRLLSMTGSLDPDGFAGGPHLTTLSSSRPQKFAAYTWTTYPEQLQAKGISWKVYGSVDGNFGDNVLAYFKAYWTNPVLAANAFAPSFPGTFEADCAAGTLPQVSWVLAPLVTTEHPPAPPEYGEAVLSRVMTALTGNARLWSRTLLLATYDENGGFFDHVAPPVAPAGTPGEYLTVSPLPADASGIAGPVGLGFRVPLLVVSPFSRGGFVSSATFDHTSILRFLETRFGAEIPAYDAASRTPGLSAWRRAAVGDLTAALNLAQVRTQVPKLPSTGFANQVVVRECVPSAAFSEATGGQPSALDPAYPVPPNTYPVQEPGSARVPSGVVACSAPAAASTRSGGAASQVEAGDAVGTADVSGLPLTAAAAASPGLAVAAAALAGVAWVGRRRRALATRPEDPDR